MPGISSVDHDSVTFTITLPAGGLFDAQVEALREAKAKQIRIGNIDAAQAIHTILLLAERGMLAYNTDPGTPTFLRSNPVEPRS